MITLHTLVCNYLTNPLGLEDSSPRFSWRIDSIERASTQTAYHILVSSSENLLNQDIGDTWDSGIVKSDASIQVPFSGKRLESRARYFWKVKAWDQNGIESASSPVAWFEMGLLIPDDWVATWIGQPAALDTEILPAPYFRKQFNLGKAVRRARIFICGLGYHELYLNGARVSDHLLDPAFTRYDRRSLYVVHDVTSLLKQGENGLGVILGNGLFNQAAPDAWYFEKSPWRASPRLLLQAHIEFTDGSQSVITSGPDWKVSQGPIRMDSTRLGEFYDARLELNGWDQPEFDDSAWEHAVTVQAPVGRLSAQLQPVKITKTLTPQSRREIEPGLFLYDLGQNVAGLPRITVQGPAGCEVILRFGEKLTQEGSLDLSELNTLVFAGEFQTDRYILKGSGEETYQPRFTYHGFRYIEVRLSSSDIQLQALEIVVLHTAFEQTGSFECSNPFLNQIQACTEWSYISNFVGFPTDCPQREKNGWTGDAHLAAEAGLYNFSSQVAYWKWLDDFKDEQHEDGSLPGIVPTSGWGYEWGNGPCWDSAYVLIPWYLYLYKGDVAILAEHYSGMKRYVDYVTRRAPSGIASFGLGDWIPPFGNPEDYTAPLAIFTTSYYYMDTVILARAAKILGKNKEAREYQRLAAAIKTAFNQRYVDPLSGLVASGSQAAQSMALGSGLAEKNQVRKMVAGLADDLRRYKGRQNTGIHSAKMIYHALAQNGRFDLAYQLACQKDFPSIGYMIESGATALWECWDGSNSQNHIMFGDISAWFYRYIAGIRPNADQPGFKQVIIQPNLAPGLEWARASHDSLYGTIHTSWTHQNGKFDMHISIPANTTALVTLPVTPGGIVTENSKPISAIPEIKNIRFTKKSVSMEIGSGEYNFSCLPKERLLTPISI
jgi:alpha-L-rhamnosidase